MDEKILKEMAESLQDIKRSLSAGFPGAFRGPVADPAPDWWSGRGPVADPAPSWTIRGPVADPAPWYLLDKARLAQLRIRKIDAAVTELEKQIDYLKAEKNLLKEEYKIK
jgi:hypothetical protein